MGSPLGEGEQRSHSSEEDLLNYDKIGKSSLGKNTSGGPAEVLGKEEEENLYLTPIKKKKKKHKGSDIHTFPKRHKSWEKNSSSNGVYDIRNNYILGDRVNTANWENKANIITPNFSLVDTAFYSPISQFNLLEQPSSVV